MASEGGEEGSRVQDKAFPFRTRHPLYTIHFRQEVVPAGNQQLRAQDPAPARRCDIEGRTWHQGLEGGNGDRNRDGGGAGTRTGMGTRERMGARTEEGTGTALEMRVEGRESLGTN